MDIMTSYNVLGTAEKQPDGSLNIKNAEGELICIEHPLDDGRETVSLKGIVSGELEFRKSIDEMKKFSMINVSFTQDDDNGVRHTRVANVPILANDTRETLASRVAESLGVTANGATIPLTNIKAVNSDFMRIKTPTVAKTDGGHPWLQNNKPTTLDGLNGTTYLCHTTQASGQQYFYNVTVWSKAEVGQ